MMPGEIGTDIWVGKWFLQYGHSAEERPEEFYQFRPQNPGMYTYTSIPFAMFVPTLLGMSALLLGHTYPEHSEKKPLFSCDLSYTSARENSWTVRVGDDEPVADLVARRDKEHVHTSYCA